MSKIPKITHFQPVVLKGSRRVTLQMTVENLVTTNSNILLMPDFTDEMATLPAKPDPNAASPYPNIELSILNQKRQQVALLYIVEHKEPDTALTLHLRSPNPNEQYTARAEMTHNDETLDVVEVAFTLPG